MTGGLSQCRRKRGFARTPEHKGRHHKRRARGLRFFVQKHAARRPPRYDSRREALTWEEVEDGVRSDAFTLATPPRGMAALEKDPWEILARAPPASLRLRWRGV